MIERDFVPLLQKITSEASTMTKSKLFVAHGSFAWICLCWRGSRPSLGKEGVDIICPSHHPCWKCAAVGRWERETLTLFALLRDLGLLFLCLLLVLCVFLYYFEFNDFSILPTVIQTISLSACKYPTTTTKGNGAV